MPGQRASQPLPRPVVASNQGISQSLSQLFHGNYPDYSFGFTLQFPIRNRSAQADAARALLEQRQLEEQLQKQKNQVEQDVRSAEIGVIQAKAQIASRSQGRPAGAEDPRRGAEEISVG